MPLFGQHVQGLRTNEKAFFILTNQKRFALIWAARDGSENQSEASRKPHIKRRSGDRAFHSSLFLCVYVKKTMSTSYQYGDVSPARYPNLESKRKRRGAASSAHPGGKKKKESKKKETVTVPPSTPTEGTIQQLVPVGLDAFAKDNVVMEQKDPLTLLEEARQGKLTDYEDETEVTVLQEGVSGPPSTQDQETQTALQSLLDELIEPLPPPPSPVALPDYLVCPYHICHLENRVSQNGWHYAKCAMYPCLLFCAEEKTPIYMRAVHEQVHSDLLRMWKHLLCFCCKSPTLNQSRSDKNPDRLYLCCSKKKCKFFHWANLPLTRRYKDWLEQETRESPVYLPPVTRGVDMVGHHPGREPWVTKALEAEKLEKRLDASLATAQVPRSTTPYEEELIQEIRRLKEAARPAPSHDVPVPDRPLTDSERRRVGELRQTKEGLFVDGRKVGWHHF